MSSGDDDDESIVHHHHTGALTPPPPPPTQPLRSPPTIAGDQEDDGDGASSPRADPSKDRVDGSNEKRKDGEELGEDATPTGNKKAKLSADAGEQEDDGAFSSRAEPSKDRVDGSNENRKEKEELGEDATPTGNKKAKLTADAGDQEDDGEFSSRAERSKDRVDGSNEKRKEKEELGEDTTPTGNKKAKLSADAGDQEDDDGSFRSRADPSKNRVYGSNEKRKDGEELGDDATPTGNKKANLMAGAPWEEYWSDTETECLLDSYLEKKHKKSPNKILDETDWDEVAATVAQDKEKCRMKINNLKSYYNTKMKKIAEGGSSNWRWLKKVEQIVGRSSPAMVAGGSNTSMRYETATPNPGSHMKLKSTASPRRRRRVVFRISGSALAGTHPTNIDPEVLKPIAREVSKACQLDVQVAIVVGGHHFFCGDTWVTATGLDRQTACQMGTLMNSIMLKSSLEKIDVQTRVQSAVTMQEVGEPYNRQQAIRHLQKGRVVIFGGVGAGAGSPLFSTDSVAAYVASEISADAVIKGISRISFRGMASKAAYPMDTMAKNFCDEMGIPVVIFDLQKPGNISRALCGENIGTLIDRTGRVRSKTSMAI